MDLGEKKVRWSTVVHKARVSISDLDHNRYDLVRFSIVRSPREGQGEWLLRILSYCMQEIEKGAFLEDQGSEKTPSLVLKDMSGQITHWYTFTLRSVKEIRQIAGRSQKVSIWFVEDEQTRRSWQKVCKDYWKLDKVEVCRFSRAWIKKLSSLCPKNCVWTLTMEGGKMWLVAENEMLNVRFDILKPHK